MSEGKKLSILGDSISTYKDVSNDVNSNHTIGDNPYFYMDPFPIGKTYWMQIAEKFGLNICVNNSWSGGNLSGKEDQYSGLNRACQLSDNNGEIPDFIIVFMGINDLGRGVDLQIFSSDYEKTLKIIKEKYPLASVCCVNLPDRFPFFKRQTEKFNEAIYNAASAAGENFFVADLFNSRLNNEVYYNNTVDGLHPDEDGMKMIAEVVEKAIADNIG